MYSNFYLGKKINKPIKLDWLVIILIKLHHLFLIFEYLSKLKQREIKGGCVVLEICPSEL